MCSEVDVLVIVFRVLTPVEVEVESVRGAKHVVGPSVVEASDGAPVHGLPVVIVPCRLFELHDEHLLAGPVLETGTVLDPTEGGSVVIEWMIDPEIDWCSAVGHGATIPGDVM